MKKLNKLNQRLSKPIKLLMPLLMHKKLSNQRQKPSKNLMQKSLKPRPKNSNLRRLKLKLKLKQKLKLNKKRQPSKRNSELKQLLMNKLKLIMPWLLTPLLLLLHLLKLKLLPTLLHLHKVIL
jgi:hypothetical protein